MEFLQLLWSEENYIFSAAIFLMLAIGILEGLLTLIGFGFSSAIDSFFPDLDISIDMPDTDYYSASEMFTWINKGNVPVLMLFICFLTFFGLIGLFLQYMTNQMFSQYIIVIPAIILSLPLISYSSRILSKIMPRDETDAVSTVTFIGRVAVITNGTARKGMPTEAKLTDAFGNTHYIIVEPRDEKHSFTKGDSVLVLSEENHKFYVTEDVNKILTEGEN